MDRHDSDLDYPRDDRWDAIARDYSDEDEFNAKEGNNKFINMRKPWRQNANNKKNKRDKKNAYWDKRAILEQETPGDE